MRLDTSFRRAMLLASALSGFLPSAAGWAQSAGSAQTSGGGAANPVVTVGGNTTPSSGANAAPPSAIQVETIRKIYQRLIQKEKDLPTAVTELGPKQVQQSGINGSVQSLLTQAPSVNSYQAGIGQNSPELTIRGVKDGLLSDNFDDVPIQDLLNVNGQGFAGSFVGAIGGFVTNQQISGVNIYPGVTTPDNQGFNGVGGTVNYIPIAPTADRNFTVEGGVGSFDLFHGGFSVNSGALGGVDGPRFYLSYDQEYNGGYVDFTPSRYRNMDFAFDKPYDGGLSNVTANVIYNTGFGYTTAYNGYPTQLQADQGQFAYYNPSQTYNQLDNRYLFADVGDSTYINPHLIAGAKIFYAEFDSDQQLFQSTALSGPQANVNPSPTNGYPVNQSDNFFEGNITQAGGIYQPLLTYNPAQFGLTCYTPKQLSYFAPPVTNAYKTRPNGNSCYTQNGQQYTDDVSTEKTFGIRPRINIFLPHNTITIGGLAAHADYRLDHYDYGTADVPQEFGYNEAVAQFPGGDHRTVLDIYAQDKIDVLHNTLHFQPGFTVQAANSSNDVEEGVAGSYSLTKFDKSFLPYFGASYDITRRINIYGDYARYAIFAPITDYLLGTGSNQTVANTAAPGPSYIHDYEAGIRYDSPTILVNADFYYEKLSQAFGFFQDFLTGTAQYTNLGLQQFHGVELNGTWKITPDWSVFATGSWNLSDYLSTYQASVTPQDGQFGEAFRDTPLSTTPEWLANFGVEYEHSKILMPNDHLDVRAYGHYVGEQYTTFDILGYPTNLSPVTGGATTTNTNYKLAAYTTFNLLATYDFPLKQAYIKDLTFTANIQNLFNLHYNQYFFQSIGAFQGVYGGNEFSTSIPGIPFNITFDVAAKF